MLVAVVGSFSETGAEGSKYVLTFGSASCYEALFTSKQAQKGYGLGAPASREADPNYYSMGPAKVFT